jgi:hypothetical protein
MKRGLLLLAVALMVAGCRDSTAPDTTPPASPRAVHSVTGDQSVVLSWVANTEPDLAGYRVYMSPCANGPGCPYDLVTTTTGTQVQVSALTNGDTRFFAVSAVDVAGNESALSREDIFDTPRPAGTNLVLSNAAIDSLTAGYDFSDFTIRPYNNSMTDIFYGTSDGAFLMICPFADTDIQDAGFATSLDAVDFAPDGGWSPTGTAELIVGHCYVVWTFDNHFAKFRVTSITPSRVVVDWAYQVATGNPELKSRRSPPVEGQRRIRRPNVWPT